MSSWQWIFGLFLLLSMAVFCIVFPLRKNKILGGLTVLLVVFISTLAYWQWGNGTAWHQYEEKQARQQQVQKLLNHYGRDPTSLIAQLKNRLQENPNSAQGWYLLGRLYSSQGEWFTASKAFAKAVHYKPRNAQYTVNYIESLWVLNHRQFTEKMRQTLYDLLNKIPNQPDAIAMLAVDAYQNHRDEQAIDYWQRLLNLVPSGSQEALALQKAIAKAQQRLHK